MTSLVDVSVLKVFVGESARHEGKPLYEALVEEARSRGLAGAVVTRGVMGFGGHNLLRTSKILRMSEDMPMVVEIVDTPGRIEDFLPVARSMLTEGTVVVESARASFHLPLRICDVMTRNPVTAAPDTPLTEVVELLLGRRIKALPVVENEKPVGVITGGDLLRRARMPLSLEVHWQLPPAIRAEHLDAQAFAGRTARDVMSSPATTISVHLGVGDALARMASGKLKRLPVVDDAGRLLGVVSRVDVLRAIGQAAAADPALPELPQGAAAMAGDVLYADVPTATPDTPLREVLARLVASPLRRVVVVDDQRRVLGVVLDRDLVASLVRRGRPGLLRAILTALSGDKPPQDELEGTARDVMRAEVFTVGPRTPLAEVITLLVEKGAKRLVVADDDNRLMGMVDRDAVLRRLAGGN
ncbi:DUF190 domain-containing protein [Fundidesulfovibrio butyratiphilus]